MKLVLILCEQLMEWKAVGHLVSHVLLSCWNEFIEPLICTAV